jgi:hypothetical protein
VIEDADLVAILKDVSSETDGDAFAPHLGDEDADDGSSSSDADFVARGTSMTTGDSVSDAISRSDLGIRESRQGYINVIILKIFATEIGKKLAKNRAIMF